MEILHGDCKAVLALLPPDSVDAVVTDPPYGLSFMNKHWDYDVPKADTWAEVLRVLKPGGYLLSFFGTRTYHRGVVAVEDAGFEVCDQIQWIYGSGFPKGLNVGKAAGPGNGWEGWNTALKPAHEPIVVAQKPMTERTILGNIKRWGVGAINVGACRVESEDGGRPLRVVAPLDVNVEYHPTSLSGRVDGSLGSSKAAGTTALGRWPANIIHDGSPEVLEAFPEAVGQCGPAKNDGSPAANQVFGALRNVTTSPEPREEAVKTAARFFYCAKASRAEREEGLDHLPGRGRDSSRNAAQPSMNGGVGNPYNRGVVVVKNYHPTVKPVALMRYLCRLVTPRGGVVLDPFTGSGTTGVAAVAEGFNFLGIEREADFLDIAKARCYAAALGEFA